MAGKMRHREHPGEMDSVFHRAGRGHRENKKNNSSTDYTDYHRLFLVKSLIR
jgi:hypothetical protein